MLSSCQPTRRTVIDVLRACQANCSFCYHKFGGHRPAGWSMSIQRACMLLDAAAHAGDTAVDITGGEPTLYPDLLPLLSHCAKLRMTPRVITNGLFDEKRLDEMQAVNPDVQFLVSIHGVGEVHDEATGVPRSYAQLTDTLKLLRSRKLPWWSNTVVYKGNCNKLKGIIPTAVYYGANASNLINFQPFHGWVKEVSDTIVAKFRESEQGVFGAIEEGRLLDHWVQVRYYPFCRLKAFEQHITNQPGVRMDPLEWDVVDRSLLLPKTAENYLQEGQRRAALLCGGNPACDTCGVRLACGGAYKSYVSLYGTDELEPYTDIQISDVHHFRRDLHMDIVVPIFNPKTAHDILACVAGTAVQPYALHVSNERTSASQNRQSGLSSCTSDVVIMVDDDIRDLPVGWNRTLLQMLKGHKDVVAISARLMTKDGKVAPNAADNTDLGAPLVYVDKIPTACCAFRRPTSSKFDFRYWGSGYEDVDFFNQLLREFPGKRLAICNDLKVVHLHTRQEQAVYKKHNQTLFESKWGKSA